MISDMKQLPGDATHFGLRHLATPALYHDRLHSDCDRRSKLHYLWQLAAISFIVVGIWLGFSWLGPVGAVVAVALNDFLYYISANVGLHREGMAVCSRMAEPQHYYFAVFLPYHPIRRRSQHIRDPLSGLGHARFIFTHGSITSLN